jgi:hypothetical protein
MMGGLKSILELGFAGVALANFGSQSWALVKRITLFLLQTSKKFVSFLGRFFPTNLFKKLTWTSNKSGNANSLGNSILLIVRLVAAIGKIFIHFRFGDWSKT